MQNNSHKKSWRHFFLNLVLLVFLAIGLGCWYFPSLSAKYYTSTRYTQIFIDGKDYGELRNISDLDDLEVESLAGEPFSRVHLRRMNNVSSPWISLWAKKAVESQSAPANIQLRLKTRSGQKISTVELKSCTPLKWVVESADGIYEDVILAVPNIIIH